MYTLKYYLAMVEDKRFKIETLLFPEFLRLLFFNTREYFEYRLFPQIQVAATPKALDRQLMILGCKAWDDNYQWWKTDVSNLKRCFFSIFVVLPSLTQE